MTIAKITAKSLADNAVTSDKLAAGAVTINDISDGEITMAKLSQVDLNIAPEILEIQVDSPSAGQNIPWLWTWLQSTLPYARRTITNSPEISVPLYKQGTYTINNYAAYDLHDNMTQTHSLKFKWIDGAGTDNLVSWAVDNPGNPISDTHPDINGGNATNVQRINISVPATVTPPTLTAPNVSYSVTNNGAGAYTFSGAASGDNPNIGPWYRGGTYTLNISATGHPIYLTTDNGTNYSSGTYFGEYTTGVTGSRTDSGTLTITVPSDAPDTLYYQCGNHSAMRGAITIKNLAVEVNNNGNYVIYAQHTQEGMKTPVEIRPIPSLVNQMCLVYDANVGKFVPQDLATYVENTPSFENKIREVAGTAELVVEDGSAVIAKVNVYDDSTYLPLVGNNPGDQAFATDTDILYIWDGSAWQQAGAANTDDLAEGTTNLFYTDARVGTYLSAQGYDTATNIVASITDSAPTTLDTLNELAAALGDDPNFATTVTNSIADKLPLAGGTITGVLTVAQVGVNGITEPSGGVHVNGGTSAFKAEGTVEPGLRLANTGANGVTWDIFSGGGGGSTYDNWLTMYRRDTDPGASHGLFLQHGYLRLNTNSTVSNLDSNAPAGSVAYVTDDNGNIFFKKPTGWVSVTSPIGTQGNPANTAAEIKADRGGSIVSGLYWLSVPGVNGGSPIEVYCDFTMDGGIGYAIFWQQYFTGYENGPTQSEMNTASLSGTSGYGNEFRLSPAEFINNYNGGASRLAMYAHTGGGSSAGGITSANNSRWVRFSNPSNGTLKTWACDNYNGVTNSASFLTWSGNSGTAYHSSGHGNTGGVNQISSAQTVNDNILFECKCDPGGSDPNHYYMIDNGQGGDTYFRVNPEYGNNSANNGTLYNRWGGFGVY